LRALMDDAHVMQARAVNVLLAVDLARHSANGWNDPALPDDYIAIRKFLEMPEQDILERIQRTARQAESEWGWYQASAALAQPSLEIRARSVQGSVIPDDIQGMAGNWRTD